MKWIICKTKELRNALRDTIRIGLCWQHTVFTRDRMSEKCETLTCYTTCGYDEMGITCENKIALLLSYFCLFVTAFFFLVLGGHTYWVLVVQAAGPPLLIEMCLIGSGIYMYRVWMSNYIHLKPWDAINHQCPNFNGDLVSSRWSWMSNYIPYITMDVITIPCPYSFKPS